MAGNIIERGREGPPRVAVALPVFNGADHLEEALLSFENQTYPHFELVICDNASTDGTREIAERVARRDARFVYKRQTEFLNARDNFIRAYGLTDKSSRYFLWACDDNIWHPRFLEELVGYMEMHPDCSACGCYLHHFGGGRAVHKVEIPMPALYKMSRLAHFIFERVPIVSLYSLMRRSAIDNITLELGDMSDYPDRYYLLQLRGSGHFHVVEQDLLAFRAGGISSTLDDAWVSTVIDVSFGEQELSILLGLPHITWLEKRLIALKFTFIALRHNIPGTVERAWLSPARGAALLLNQLRPSPWRVVDGSLRYVGK